MRHSQLNLLSPSLGDTRAAPPCFRIEILAALSSNDSCWDFPNDSTAHEAGAWFGSRRRLLHLIRLQENSLRRLLIKILLKAREDLPDLVRPAEVGHGIGD